MKRKWIVLSLLAMTVMVLSVGFVLSQANLSGPGQIKDSATLPRNSNIAGLNSNQISLNSQFPAYPQKILVYKTAHPAISREILETYAKKFNIVDGIFRDGENAMSLQSEDLVFSVEIEKPSGTIRYITANRPNAELDSPSKLPSDEEAVRIATQFLKENNLYPDGIFFRRAERNYARFADSSGNQIPTDGRIVVWFGRSLNNFDVKGTQLYVEIGGNGDIIRYLANWRSYMPYKEYPIKSPDLAFEELKQVGIATGVMNPDTISIDSVTLAYATKSGAYKEDYLEPVWVFTGEAVVNGSAVEQVSKSIPALTDDAVKSLSS